MKCATAAMTALLLAIPSASAATANDGGGRDVSVAMFSAQVIRAVTITPIGPGTWAKHCEGCDRKPLLQPLHIGQPMEIFAGGTFKITDESRHESRTATGLWHLRATADAHGQLETDVVLTLPSEHYVAAVLNAEATADEPAESLAALAIVARTYALNGNHYSAQAGHLPAELCDSTQCQAMLPGQVPQRIKDATQSTAGETLWFQGRRAEAFFSQSCGGVTEEADAIWPNLRRTPYLRSHNDPYCVRRNTTAWHAEMPLSAISQIGTSEGWRLPAHIVGAHVLERSSSHRALRVALSGDRGENAIISATALRFGIGRALGWNRVRSDAYEVAIRGGQLVFDGRGHGHGVGLCQEGATEMASEGKRAREILAFYFPGTSVRITPGDDGWRETRTTSLVLGSTTELTIARKQAVEQLWNEARRRFGPKQGTTPHIAFSPTTELFRQMTSQPGWILATTHGNQIILQPDAILQAHGRHASATVLHEMLHVLVESESTVRAPLWLREGLVEVLADEHPRENKATARPIPASVIESSLINPGSQSDSERAHAAAAQLVRSLIVRYGSSTVRGWLSTGVPADAK